MKRLKWKLLTIGSMACVLALDLAVVLAPGCRYSWYQPKEPENLSNLLKNRSNSWKER